MNRREYTIIRILSVISIVLVIITTYLLARLCATINAYSIVLAKQNQNLNVGGDYIDNSVDIYIASEDTIKDNQISITHEILMDFIKTLFSTIGSAIFSVISIKIVFVRKQNKTIIEEPSKKGVKSRHNNSDE